MKVRRGPAFGTYLAIARLWLTIERLWPALWPAAAVVGVFVTAALFDLFAALPGWAHVLALLAFAGAFALAARQGLRTLAPVDDDDARHRIEVDSGLHHRPLTALEDSQAAGLDDPKAIALWTAHRKRMEENVRNLALRLPAAGLSRRDPWSFRIALVMLLVIGASVAGSDGMSRLGRSFVPIFGGGGGSNGAVLDIWITPPTYTGTAPVLLQADSRNATHEEGAPLPNVRVPIGSTVLAQVTGGRGLPSLLIGDDATEFARVDADAYHLETEINSGSRLAVEQRGTEIAAWSMNVVPDERPIVSFVGHPEGTPRLRMRFEFDAEDDYALNGVTAVIRRADGEAIPGGDDEISIELPLSGRDRTKVLSRSDHDLTSHIWAGLPVLIHLEATDSRGQTGISDVLPAVLPERRFNHPVAREVIDIRKELTTSSRSRRLAALKLDTLSEERDRFSGATDVFLGLSVARARLRHDQSETAVASVQEILWDVALRIEEGVAAVAGRELAEAQRALEEAMDRGANLDELERLMDELQKALEKFIASMMREFQQRGMEMPLDPDAQMLGSEELKKMLDQAREMMRQGSMDAAKQMMAELQRMLESLRSALARGRMDPKMREAQRTMGELRDIIRRQQKLLDESFRQSEEGSGEPDTSQSLEEQEAVRRELGELMQKFSELMGEMPEGLGNAEREMREAEKALGDGEPGEAIGPQTRALEELRKGAQNGARGMARRFGQGRQFGFGQGFGPGFQGGYGPMPGPMLQGLRPGNRDPFGRPIEEGGTGTATGTVKIPTESEMQRAREILRELRERAGDLWRPEFEREYIDRLLRQF